MNQTIYTRLIWYHEYHSSIKTDRWFLGMYVEDSYFDEYCPFLRAGSFTGSI